MSLYRYRCGACGNLARFEVVTTRRMIETHSTGVDGAPAPRRSRLLGEWIEEVVCAWCGHGEAVEELRLGDEAR